MNFSGPEREAEPVNARARAWSVSALNGLRSIRRAGERFGRDGGAYNARCFLGLLKRR